MATETAATAPPKKAIWEPGKDNPKFEHAGIFDVLTNPDVPEEIRKKYKESMADLQIPGKIEIKAGKKYPSVNFSFADGYLYGLTYNHDNKTFSVWRTVKTGGGSGDKKYYKLAEIYHGTVDSINKFLAERPSNEYWNYEDTIISPDGIPVVVLSRKQAIQFENTNKTE
jgi:hypothetical protein